MTLDCSLKFMIVLSEKGPIGGDNEQGYKFRRRRLKFAHLFALSILNIYVQFVERPNGKAGHETKKNIQIM